MGVPHNRRMLASHDRAARAELMRRADLCAAALTEARRMSDSSLQGSLHAQLLSRIRDMLDELDESLLALDHTQDRGAIERVCALHRGFEELNDRQERLGTA